MDLDNLRQILDLVRQHDLAEFEIEHEGLKLKIRKDAARGASSAPAVPPAPDLRRRRFDGGAGRSDASAPSAAADDAEADAPEEVELAVVKSPIVGTFYRSSGASRAAVRGDRLGR